MTPVQETPQLFTLITVLSVLASFVVFLIVGYRIFRGRSRAAGALLFRWAACAVVYLAISIGVSALTPPRVIEQGQDWCFDEWCIAVEAVHRGPSSNGTGVTVTTDLRISNKGRSPESVRGFWVFLRDDDDRRYAPTPGPWQDVVASKVPARGSVRTSMAFVIPNGVTPRGFVTNHGGSTPCGLLPGLLEIGQGGCLFHKPNMIHIG